jgi:hypothetical protein
VRGVLLVSLTALLIAGWWLWLRDPNSVRLATGPKPEPLYCNYLSYAEGELVEDGRTGTAYKYEDDVHPLTWPIGFTARRSGESIEVLSPDGTVWAVTGHKYHFFGVSLPVWTGPGCFIEIDSFTE